MPIRAREADARSIEARIAEIESRTGVHVTTVVVAKSDTYNELPWIAFALAASLAALSTVVMDSWLPHWTDQWQALSLAVLILAAGGASALATLWVPAWARLFLRGSRRDVEVKQYAQALFLTRELFVTPQRNGLLILVSRFERKIQLWPDSGLRERVHASEWHAVIARMTPLLREGHPHRALQEGLSAVEALLVRKGVR
jgi:uncharacterized membrane protein